MSKLGYANPEPCDEFAGWIIIDEVAKEDYEDFGIQGTHNKHYLCENLICGINYCMEKTTIRRNWDKECLAKCSGCSGDKSDKCYYSKQRGKALHKVPNRTPTEFMVGQDNGFWKVISAETYSSIHFHDHNSRVECECMSCGAHEILRFDYFREKTYRCECNRSHSSGEQLIINLLTSNNIKFKPEYTFHDLFTPVGGMPRFDIGVIYRNKLSHLIEFDGAQHFTFSEFFHNDQETFNIALERDRIKNEYCIKNNIPLIRIPYWRQKDLAISDLCLLTTSPQYLVTNADHNLLILREE